MSESISMENYGSISEKNDKVNLIQNGGSNPNGTPTYGLDPREKKFNADMFFKDGKRNIDYVLVWEEDLVGDKKLAKKEEIRANSRKNFEANLKKLGVETEEDSETSEKKKIHYLKLYIPFELMCHYAEELNLRAPIQVHPYPSENWSERILKMFCIPNFMAIDFPNVPLDFYTCQFKKSKMDRFLGSESEHNYFLTTQRHQVAYEILATQVYGKRKKAEIGIDRLLDEEIYTGAYALHEGPYKATKEQLEDPTSLNSRQILYHYWAKWSLWYKYQPLDHIREYYGEKIGMYFAWLGLYTCWLLPASIVGILVFLYGVITFTENVPGNEVCRSNQTFLMCPLCDENIGCSFWYLSDVCLYVRIAYLFDHPGTVFFAIFMSLWGVTFLENWKRKNASLAHHWDVMDYVEEEERPRPQFAALCVHYEANPVTGVMEPYFPISHRIPRIMTGAACIIFMMILVVVFIIAVIIYRVLIAIPFFQNPLLRSKAPIFASSTAAVVNLILIMAIGRVYENLALKLTQWEMHRTQSDFEDQLTFKVFLFEFFNYYSSIIYVAFFKGRFTGYPGNYSHFFGMRNEECSNGGCLIELAQQLAVIMIGKQVINNCQEVFLPKLKTWLHRFTKGLMSEKESEKTLNSWEADYELIDYEGLFEEYLEMVLQFGFITIFVAAFPLAPFFALINNWLEIRLDASKLVCETRRPVAERSQNIGVWFEIMDILCKVSVISNAFLIAFTSEIIPKLVYRYDYKSDLSGYINFSLSQSPNNSYSKPCRYQGFRDETGEVTPFYWKLLCVRLLFVIMFEHVVFFISRMLDVFIPDVPESLSLKIRREQFLAKQALQDTELKVSSDDAENEIA